MKKFITFLLFLVSLGIFLPAIVRADDNVTLPSPDKQTTSLTIVPSIYESVVAPGKNEVKSFEIRNGSNFPLPIKCYIRVFGASDETGGVAIEDQIDTNRLAPTSWISAVEPDFILQPKSTKELQVNFNPPAALPPGGYYAILFAEPLLPESFLSDNSLVVGGRIGSLLFLIGPGDIHEKARIVSFDLPKFFWSNQSSGANIRFENQGNIHLKPSGKIIVTNLISRHSQTVDIPEFTVLPGKIRKENIDITGLKWPGVYRVELTLSYGQDKTSIRSAATFYYLPLVQIIVILLMVTLAIVLISHKSRKRILKALRVVVRGEKA